MAKTYIQRRTFKGLGKDRIYFKNFRGIDRFNPNNHKPTFAIFLEEEQAEQMKKEGWAVKYTKVSEDAPEGAEPRPYIKVTIKFDGGRPSVVNMVIDGDRTVLDENSVKVLDAADISTMSIRIRPYVWDETGKHGAVAYLDKMNVYIEPDELDEELESHSGEDAEEMPFD